MSGPQIVVHTDLDVLAEAIAVRLLTRLIDAQASSGQASVALTGGGVGTACLRALAASPAAEALDWSRLDVWWSDERFLPAGDPERNETGARSALLDHVAVPAERIHAMPASDGADGADPAAAAQRYSDALAGAAGSHGVPAVPAFDVLLLGVGPDGHVASLFPDHSAAVDQTGSVIAVHEAPKPPPTRLSLTFPAINAAREVWLLVGGADKAGAVRRALSGSAPAGTPASGVRGRERTLWLIDRAAAGELPAELVEPPS